MISSTILPMKLTNLSIVMKKIQTAFTTTAASRTDLTDAVRWDHDLVDLLFGEGFATVPGTIELAAARY
jgi:hypothetical protein